VCLGDTVGEVKVHFLGEAGPGAGDVLAEGLFLVGIIPDRAVCVDVSDLFQQEVSGLGVGRAVENGMFEGLRFSPALRTGGLGVFVKPRRVCQQVTFGGAHLVDPPGHKLP